MNEDLRPFSERLFVLDDVDGWRTLPVYNRDCLVITPHGIFTVRREELVSYARPATRRDWERILGQGRPAGPTQGNVELPTRLPFSLVLTAVSFFREVWQRHRREDVLLIYYFYAERRYELQHPPLERGDEIGVGYKMPSTPPEAVRLGSLHSHGRIQAHHSIEDRLDDVASPGLHIVIGDVDQATPSIVCTVSDGRSCYPVPVADVFEEMQWPVFPPEWLVEVPRSQFGGHTYAGS